MYKPWGEKRYPTGASGLPTTYRYTGQRQESYINLYWYGSRWYDDSLGRFTQPDTIVPDSSQGTQAWDRYSYVNNNAVNHTDPSGHCFICIGAAVGAVVGGAIYAVTTAASGREWDTKDFLTSVATGAVGGALIGSGVGAAAGVASFAAIGAGSGVIGGELGYSATAGKNFDAGNMVISSATSGAAGLVTGGVAGSGIGGGAAAVINAAANGGASAAQYAITQISNGQPVNPATAVANGVIGAGVSGIFSAAFGGSAAGDYAKYWMSPANTNNPAIRDSLLTGASRMASGGLFVNGVEQTIRSGTTNWLTDLLEK